MPSPDSTTMIGNVPASTPKNSGYHEDENEDGPTSTGVELHPAEGIQECKQEGSCGRHRPRKRKLYAQICKQMEFYFSDANVTKNRMMREIVEQANKKSEGYVELNTFLEFTKIQQLTASPTHIKKALVHSEKLELSEDKEKARRKIPFNANNVKSENDVEECTIYVENIPRDADHEWLERIFQAFGPPAYISLPKFKNGQHKGFSFVEFDDVDAARRCVEAYGEEGACLPKDIDPAQLRSIKSFQEIANESNSKGEASPALNAKLRKRKAVNEVNEEAPKPKKEKGDDSSSGVSETEEEPVEGSEDVGGKCIVPTSKTKKNKKRKKNKAKKSGEAKLESESIMLKVLPKKTWRQLRNRYLNLQRGNMSKLKKQLQRENLRAQHFKNFYQPSNNHPQHESGYTGESSRANVDHVMKIKLAKPAESSESFRRKISVELAEQDEDEAMISGFIKFIDYKDGDSQAFVRVNADDSFSERAKKLVEAANEAFFSAAFLSVGEVDEYKRSVQAALKQKQKEHPKKSVRGKDRLMKAATKSNHIYFGSDDDEEVTDEPDSKKPKVESCD